MTEGEGEMPIEKDALGGQVRSKVKSNFRLLGFRLGEGDARPRASAKCVSRRTPSEVKDQVKFQVASMELKLRENNTR